MSNLDSLSSTIEIVVESGIAGDSAAIAPISFPG